MMIFLEIAILKFYISQAYPVLLILKKLNDFLKKDMEETSISKSERTSIIDIGNCFLLSRATASKMLLDALKVLYMKLNRGCRALYQCVFVPDMVPKVLTVIDCFETY